MTLIQKLVPVNIETEKKKFFFDPYYNPQFIYSDKILPNELSKYVHISDEYLPIAQKIIQTAMQKKNDISLQKGEENRERILSKEEVEKIITEFLEKEGLRKVMTLRFTDRAIARTSVHNNTLIIRLPVEYTRSSLCGMLYHEIGTHQLRSMNDRQQVWRGKTDELKLHPHYVTEEGVAVLHSLLPRNEKLLLYQSLNYITVHFAQTHSFSETYMMLKEYVSERAKRFDICVRVKRGIKDTSQPGAFPKDQVYLKGAIEVLRWLGKHDFDPTSLYIGKVSMEDVDHLRALSKVEPLLLPHFFTDSPQEYKKGMQKIAKENFLL